MYNTLCGLIRTKHNSLFISMLEIYVKYEFNINYVKKSGKWRYVILIVCQMCREFNCDK